MNENETLTHVRWKKYDEQDAGAVLDRVLDEHFPYAVPTGTDRYKETAARGMPIAAKHKTPRKRMYEMPNGDTIIYTFEVRRKNGSL